MAYIQTRQPDKAVAPLAQAFGVEPGSCRRAPAGRADDGAARVQRDGRRASCARRSRSIRDCRTRTCCSARTPCSEIASTRASSTSARSSRSIRRTRWRSTGSARPTRVSRTGTRRFQPSSGRSGSTPTSAARTSCSGARIWRRDSRLPPKACCGGPWSYDPNNKAARYLYGQVLQRLGSCRRCQGAVRHRLQAAGRTLRHSEFGLRSSERVLNSEFGVWKQGGMQALRIDASHGGAKR